MHGIYIYIYMWECLCLSLLLVYNNNLSNVNDRYILHKYFEIYLFNHFTNFFVSRGSYIIPVHKLASIKHAPQLYQLSIIATWSSWYMRLYTIYMYCTILKKKEKKKNSRAGINTEEKNPAAVVVRHSWKWKKLKRRARCDSTTQTSQARFTIKVRQYDVVSSRWSNHTRHIIPDDQIDGSSWITYGWQRIIACMLTDFL